MEISSSSLFHHKKKFKYFIEILYNGFEHRASDESLPFTPNSSSAFYAPGGIQYDFQFGAVCFTDLPSDKIQPHIDQYGEYIIGLSKDWGIINGITPIRYVHRYTPDVFDDKVNLISSFVENPDMRSVIIHTVNELLSKSGIQQNITKEDISNLPDKFQYLISGYDHIINDICHFIFSHFGLMRAYEGKWEDRVTGELTHRRFYDEREWRSLDTDGTKGNLTFTAENIDKIYVPTEKEKKEVVLFFKKHKSQFEIKNFNNFVRKIGLTNEVNK